MGGGLLGKTSAIIARDANHDLSPQTAPFRALKTTLGQGVTALGALMRDVDGDKFAGTLQANLSIESQLDAILNADRGAVFAVHDDQYNVVGALPREVVVELLSAPQRKE